MRITNLFLAVMLAGAPVALGQPTSTPAAPTHPVFKLGLDPLYLPGYEPTRELRLALWDSSMSRLELAAAREQWAFRNPGPTGPVLPFEGVQLPMRLNMVSGAQSLLLGPWSPQWQQLSWQEKAAAGAQTGVLAWALIQALAHIH
jgi:hypothetical protein